MRTRLVAGAADAAVLRSVGECLGSLAGADLAVRCSQGRLDARGRAASRKQRKQALTAGATSRWAGAITRTSEDAWWLAERNLAAEARSLRARAARIRGRLAVAAGDRRGRARGYSTQAERWQKQQRLQALTARLAGVEACQAEGRMSVCRGGKGLARVRHNLQAAGLGEDRWRQRWQASTTGLDLYDLQAETAPEVMPSRVALVLAAPGGPVKPVVKGLMVVAGQVEQAADLGDGQRDQAAAFAAGRRRCRFALFMPVRGACPAGRRGLSTDRGSPF